MSELSAGHDAIREAEARVKRRERADCADQARDIQSRLNHFLRDDGNRALMSLTEMKVLGASSDMLADIRKRLAS